MSNALLSGVSGLQAYQQMMDVTGNNLANLNTTAFKASTVSFSDMLSETMREASQPTATSGGTNPMQIGSGVQVASIDVNTTQGSMVNTGQPLDMAIDGAGYFTLSNGQKEVYTRAGSFKVDADYYLVDPATGYRVQRIGSQGVAEGFQDPTSNDIRIPYNIALPANETTSMSFTGNLSADASDPTTNVLGSGQIFTLDSGAVVSDTTLLSDIKGVTVAAGDVIHISGTKADGSYVGGSATGVNYTLASGDTVGTLLTAISNAFPGSTASIVNGEIELTDNASGYSQTSMNLSYTKGATNANGSFPLPNNFTVVTAGGAETKSVNLQVYDAQGTSHVLAGTFVRHSDSNLWDFVVNSVSGDATVGDGRISGIKFNTDGSFGGIATTKGPDGSDLLDGQSISLTYANDPTNKVTLKLDLGTVGAFNGLSQFGGASTVAPSGQDGYASGYLSSMSVGTDGLLEGVFSNGVRRDIAALQLSTFQNASGLQAVGNNYFVSSTNSGDAVAVQASTGGAGTIQGGELEKSNVDQATEFVNLIQAQSGFEANSRTIKVANQLLTDLTNLIQ